MFDLFCLDSFVPGGLCRPCRPPRLPQSKAITVPAALAGPEPGESVATTDWLDCLTDRVLSTASRSGATGTRVHLTKEFLQAS